MTFEIEIESIELQTYEIRKRYPVDKLRYSQIRKRLLINSLRIGAEGMALLSAAIIIIIIHLVVRS